METTKFSNLWLCERTGNFKDSPCEEAFEIPYVYIDKRNTDDLCKLHDSKIWYLKGRNHRIENGRLTRDLDQKRWVVEINDFNDLLKFCEKHGEIVLSIDTDGIDPFFSIEIYDDYRE